MAYAMRADGLADVHLPDGSVMPMALSPEQLEAMGHSPIADAAARPDMGPDERTASVASPFGVKVQRGGEQQLADFVPPGGGVPFGKGVSDKFAGVRVRLGDSSTPATPPGVEELARRQSASKEAADVEAMSPAKREAYFARKDAKGSAGPAAGQPELAEHSAPRGGGGTTDAPSDSSELTPEELARIAAEGSSGGGPVRSQQYLKERKEKYTAMGAVPAELSADITRRQNELDAQAQSNLDSSSQGRYLANMTREQNLSQQQADLEDARQQREAVNARLSKLQQTRDARELEVANMKAPDMHGYWKDKGIASEIMTGISIALGGYLQGMRGGDNPGLTMANQAIDRWFSSQKDAYERSSGKLNSADSEYAKALALYGTPELAEAELKARAGAIRDGMGASQAERLGIGMDVADKQLNLQQSALAREAARAQWYQQAGAKAVEDTIATRQVGGSGGETYSKFLARAAADAENKRKIFPKAGGDDKRAVRFSDGSIRYATDPRAARQAQKEVEGASSAIDDISRLQQLGKDAGSRVWGEDERGQAEALANSMVFKIHDAFGVTTFQQATKDIIHDMTGDPVSFFRNPAAVAKLNEVKRQMQLKLQEKRKFLGGPRGGASEPEPAEELPESAQDLE